MKSQKLSENVVNRVPKIVEITSQRTISDLMSVCPSIRHSLEMKCHENFLKKIPSMPECVVNSQNSMKIWLIEHIGL